MNKLTELFSKPSLDVWVDLLKKELKEVSLAHLDNVQDLEGIAIKAYQDHRSINLPNPGEFPFTRGYKHASNTWLNRFDIDVQDETLANKKALAVLMQGIDCLRFNLKKDQPNLSILLQGIEIQYIHIEFHIETLNQLNSIEAYFEGGVPNEVVVMLQSGHPNYAELIQHIKPNYTVEINAYALQAAGASIQDQLAYALSDGHEVFLELIKHGVSTEKAKHQLHFTFGVGGNYLNEISKFRAFRTCWSRVISAYFPNDTNLSTTISAQIGHLNKSFADPHTNLLRQTTEVLSAISGGVDRLSVHPYDALSKHGTSKLAERMARNIPLILAEESYLNAVIDPLGGSYVLEEITHQLNELAWKRFIELDSMGGIRKQMALDHLRNSITETANKRIHSMKTKNSTYIGINKFMNPTPFPIERVKEKCFLGFEPIYLEDYSAQHA
jgi:methylmalonyl-CoA mutase